jgi:hypothetical protein
MVTLEPKGIDRPPSSSQEVYEAIFCVLEALKVRLDLISHKWLSFAA